jgi:glycine/D-amino acid oxidase-like deaminating enzyme
MSERVDVVVARSGALGSSTAFHLAKAARSVVLVDKAEIGSQTSPRAARDGSAALHKLLRGIPKRDLASNLHYLRRNDDPQT